MDLLKHKVLVSALFRRLDIPVHVHGLFQHLVAQHIIKRGAVRLEHRDIVILQQIYVARIFQQSRYIRCQNRTVCGAAYDKRAVLAHAIDGIRVVNAYYGQREGSLQHRDDAAQGFEHIPLFVHADQVRYHLCIRLGRKGASPLQQALL